MRNPVMTRRRILIAAAVVGGLTIAALAARHAITAWITNTLKEL